VEELEQIPSAESETRLYFINVNAISLLPISTSLRSTIPRSFCISGSIAVESNRPRSQLLVDDLAVDLEARWIDSPL
jgi:hypothetical protein